jgi:membrane associated rhomboid family serine protease
MNYLFLDTAPPFMLLLQSIPLTLLLLALTIFTSVRYMERGSGKHQFIFVPYEIKREKTWYRFWSKGLVHGDWIHLFFNMYALYLFGGILERTLVMPELFGQWGRLVYLGLYLSGLPMASLYTYYKEQDNPGYRALGASGAISSVVFAVILLYPFLPLGLIFIPIEFPAILFGLLYLAYSHYMGKRNMDNVGHDAHYWGSIWGFVFLLVLKPVLFLAFINQIKFYLTNLF